jgi:hypothetical protein
LNVIIPQQYGPVQSFDITKDVTCIGTGGSGVGDGVGDGCGCGEEDGNGCDEGVGVGDGCEVGEGIGVLTDDFLTRSR